MVEKERSLDKPHLPNFLDQIRRIILPLPLPPGLNLYPTSFVKKGSNVWNYFLQCTH